jgi:hypothetical protein
LYKEKKNVMINGSEPMSGRKIHREKPMKNRMSRKLQLNRETLRYLHDASLADAAGGVSANCPPTYTCGDSCGFSCGDTCPPCIR